MSAAFLLLAALKATLLAGGGLLGAQILPLSWLQTRRLTALSALWTLLVMPWLPLSASISGMRLSATLSALPSGTRIFLALWLFGTITHALRLVFEWRGLRLKLRQSRAHSRVEGIEIRIVGELASPCVFGAWRACVLMPAAALEWPSRQWAAALRHELQHARQSDGLHQIVCALIRAVFWWNPLVRGLCHRVEIESELCCDQAASSGSKLSKRAYGEMLLGLATDASWRMAPGWSTRRALRERLERLLSPGACGRVGAHTRVAAALCVLATALAAVGCLKNQPAAPKALQDEAALRLDANPFPSSNF